MKQNVIVKGNIHKGCKGFTLTLSPDIPFEELKQEVADKFEELRSFLKDNKMAAAIEGRMLSVEEEQEILDVITAHSDISILYVLEQEAWKDGIYEQMVNGDGTIKIAEPKAPEVNIVSENVTANNCYRGTLRSGQVVQSEDSVVIVGDVNPGGKVLSCGNIIILGSLKGIACAGLGGNRGAFVAALEMNPMQIQIDNIMAKNDNTKVLKSRLRKKKMETPVAKIAILKNEDIYIENLDREGLAKL